MKFTQLFINQKIITMDSYEEDERIGLNVRTHGGTMLTESEFLSDSTIHSELTQTMDESLESSVDASLITKKYAKDRLLGEESDFCSYKNWKTKTSKASRSNSLNDTRSSSILAGNLGIASINSSDSFHSAQSTVMSTEEATTNLNIALTESKQRDTNYNFDSSTESEASIVSTMNTPIDDQTSHLMLPFLERVSRELNICPGDLTKKRENLLKRFSGPFSENPEEFKNRLVTIIEESEMNNQQSQMEKSHVNSDRVTEELRKICKYIMDESMPVGMIVSPTSLHDKTRTSPFRKMVEKAPGIEKNPEIIDLCTPPQISGHKVYRKTPRFVKHAQGSSQSPLCIATLKKGKESPRTPVKMTPRSPLDKSEFDDSFMYWERYCEKNATPLSESKRPRRSCSVPDIIYRIESARIKKNADIQLRALEEPDSFSTSALYESLDQETSEEDSLLEKSVLEEVALKRQRCYETGRISLNSSSEDDEQVLEHLNTVINRCGEYQQCLQKNRSTIHKTLGTIMRESPKNTKSPSSIFNQHLLNRSKSCVSINLKSSVPSLRGSPVMSTNVTPIKRTPSTSQKITERKTTYFPTPGSSCRKPFLRSKPAKYFPSPKSPEKSSNTLKPRKVFTGMEYFGYSTVRSPVADYINSTDSKLVQNIQGKIKETLLTPRSTKNTRSNTVEALRIPLSKQNELKDDTENIPMNAAKSFPKVIYRPASRVRDISVSPSKVYGEREKILRDVNNRMIIQHASRFHYGEAEESIHVSKPAAKTNCLGSSSSAKLRKPWK